MIGERIREIDIFKKVPRDFSEGTNGGGCVSILTAITIIFFIVLEGSNYLHPQLKTALSTNNRKITRKEMKIFLDIQFPRFPCELIAIDIEDEMLSHHSNIASLKKWRLDKNGKYIDRSDFEILNYNDPFQQLKITREAVVKQYGCRVIGDFTVKEAPGDFHLSSHAYQANYVRLLMQGTIKSTNISHIIHKLHFGETNIQKFISLDPFAILSPLNSHKIMYEDKQKKQMLSHYHLSVVPTKYFGSVRNYETYQFTFNQNSWNSEGEMPAVYFNYEIEGVSMEISPKASTFGQFLLNLCFIIGGVYTIGSFIDQMVYKFTDNRGYSLIN